MGKRGTAMLAHALAARGEARFATLHTLKLSHADLGALGARTVADGVSLDKLPLKEVALQRACRSYRAPLFPSLRWCRHSPAD